jgi:hypothetical protein
MSGFPDVFWIELEKRGRVTLSDHQRALVEDVFKSWTRDFGGNGERPQYQGVKSALQYLGKQAKTGDLVDDLRRHRGQDQAAALNELRSAYWRLYGSRIDTADKARIREAMRRAVADLQDRFSSGGQPRAIPRHVISALATVYKNAGGRITAKSEDSPFVDFLDAALSGVGFKTDGIWDQARRWLKAARKAAPKLWAPVSVKNSRGSAPPPHGA